MPAAYTRAEPMMVKRWLQQVRSDEFLAAGLFVLNVIELVVGPLERGPWIAAMPTAALLTLPLARRRQAPLVVLLLVVSGYTGQVAVVGHRDSLVLLLSWVLAVYSVAVYSDVRASLAGLAVGALPIWVFLAAHPDLDPVDVSPSELVLLAVPWLAGRAVHQFRSAAELAQQRAQALERAARAEAELAATAERARIAREIHDIVSHTVSLMVVQAEAGDALFDKDPARSRENLQAIQRAGRQAMTELRHMLGVLRTHHGHGNSDTPLASLLTLVEDVRAAGLDVELRVVGEPTALEKGIELSVYRIVQEGLTNALKHAGERRASVEVRYDSDGVEIEVRDSGEAPGDESTGFGLVGVRERVALYGGQMSAGPIEGGGFALRARLPTATS